ncbi:MAG: DUF4365 domain-containing protein [Geobacter sp.]|nr:DUF4365 domain-containing protein [Geobacter sp.]
MPLPKTERLGVSALDHFFSEQGWLFREQPTHDYGIDAHVEIVENERPTGKLIALQIKSGASFFKEETDDSYIFRTDDKHVAYWVGHSMPVVLVIYNTQTKTAHWQHVSRENVESTGKYWKIEIPKDNTLANAKHTLDAFESLTQPEKYIRPTEESEPETPEPEPPRPPALPKIQLAKLPVTGEDLFGREKELKALDEAWQNPNTTILTLVAFGGVGKTSLVNHWLNRMGRDNFRGAGRVYGWSFYSQGAKEGTQASADEFFAQTLEWFGDPNPAQGSPWERGLRLAGLVRESRTLLILDGLEPIQYPTGPMQGRLKDQGLQALTRELRQYNPGLLVITTRVAVEDIADVGTVKLIDLENLSEGAGAQLLEKLGVKRSPDERKAAVREFGGHALALNLLGRFISVVYEGDIRKRDIIGDLTEEVKHGGHARRVMASYDIWLAGTPELGILHLMGLFDRPAVSGAIRVLREPPAIPGLTDKLENLSDTQWQFALQHLRDLRLLANKDEHRPDTLDCHPLVREHFGEKLRHEKPEAWKQAHSRLYDYFRVLPEKTLPDTLEEMEPLFAAVAHGCLAGRFQEVHDEVIAKRIRRGDAYYIRKHLGAIGSWISVLSNFFNEPWRSTVTELNDSTAAEILNNAGYALFAVGRLRESVQPMQAALESHVKQKNWEETTKDANNLSEILLSLGEVVRAVEYGRQSVEFAERSGDGALKEVSLATLANALYQQGSLSEAESLFIEAETHLKERQPEYFYIYGRLGYRYCDLLLRRGRYGEVRKRSEKTLGWARQGGLSLLALALDNISIGRSFLLQAVKEKTDDDILNVAGKYLDRAIEGLRAAGQLDNLPHGLLARAHLHRVIHDFAKAHTDLEEVRELAEWGEMKLLLADFHLESARLAWDRLAKEGTPKLKTDLQTKLKTHVREARRLIEETGYGRRNGEIAELEGAVQDNLEI